MAKGSRSGGKPAKKKKVATKKIPKDPHKKGLTLTIPGLTLKIPKRTLPTVGNVSTTKSES
jgi:hypothetical protein